MEDDRKLSYLLYESVVARNERTIRRLVIAVIIAIILMFASNACWLYVWTQYDYVAEDSSITYQQDGQGINSINMGNQEDVRYYSGAEVND